MRMIKSNRGVTVVTLTVTVMIILIITSLLIYNANDNVYIKRLTNMYNDIANLRDKVASYYEEYGDIPASIKCSVLPSTGFPEGENDKGGAYYVIDLKLLDGLTLNYGKDYDKIKDSTDVGNNKDVYIINDKSHNIFYLQGVQVNQSNGTQVYYTDDENIDTEEVHLVDVYEGFNREKEVNSPTLGNENDKGLIPIKYDEQKNAWVICSEDDPTWYDYSEDEMKWANAMASDGKYKKGAADTEEAMKNGTAIADADLGSMFVWIPRFAYSINEYKVEKTGVDGTTQNITDVEFLKGNTNVGAITGNSYPTDYTADNVNKGDSTPMIVHPAFKFGDKELNGIWVGKFEASMAENNTNTAENNNVTNKTVKVLPNKNSWRYIQIGNAFLNCYNMKDNSIYNFSSETDTHLMKNSEWGAVADLSASQYGVIPAINNVNNAGGQSYKDNKNQSTTGNTTGIYDMNGGAQEYVAGYYDNGFDNLSINGTTNIFTNNKLNSKYVNYWNRYDVGDFEKENGNEAWSLKNTEGNRQLYRIANERLKKNKDIKGDAFMENIGKWSYYGRYAKVYTDGTGNRYDAFEVTTWLTPTINEKGELIDTGENEKDQYTNGLYGEDYTLIGIHNLPFIRRGGRNSDKNFSGVFAYSDATGAVYAYVTFRAVLSL